MKESVVKSKQCYKFYNAVSQLGKDKFYIELLEANVTKETMKEQEIYYIEKFNSYIDGYNSTYGGDAKLIHKQADVQDIKEKFKQGIKAETLAKEYGVCKATIFRTIHDSGYYVRQDPSGCNKENLQSLVEKGLTNLEIANLLGMKQWTIARRLRKYGIRRKRTFINHRPDFDYLGFAKDYRLQMPVKDICTKYNISNSTYQRIKSSLSLHR